MVEEECRRYKPTKNYLEHLGPMDTPAFETELMRNELERIQNRLPMEGLSMKRYELPPPPPGKLSEVGAWTESVRNSMAQLEHQSVRAINLELMMDYGCDAWKANLEVLTALQAKAQAQLQELRKEIQEVNWQRKSKQMQAGEKLRALEAHWVLLVSKNYEIEQACAGLEEEILYLRSQGRTTLEQVVPTNGHTRDGKQQNGDTKESSDEEDKKSEQDEPMEVAQDETEETLPQDPEQNQDTGKSDDDSNQNNDEESKSPTDQNSNEAPEDKKDDSSSQESSESE